MNLNKTMVAMLRQLLQEMDVVQSQGAGLYTCAPFAKRFNKLVEQTRALHGAGNPLVATFDALDEDDPKDPSAKGKRLTEIRVEITQLISFLEAVEEPAST